MGNATSGEGGGDLDLSLSKQEEGPTAAGENLLDFSVLFQSEGLHKALLGVKEPTGGVLSTHKEALVKWLKGLIDREETTVNIVQVMDFLTNKGASKDEVLEFFSEVDREGEGVADVTALLVLLKETPTDLVQALIPCHTLPGALDVYIDDKSALAGAGKKLVQFLQAHRVASEQLTVSCMQHIHSSLSLREKLVDGRFRTQTERENEEELLGGGAEQPEGRERMIITKCHSKIAVSSNARTMDHLTDGRMDTYWQSNGSPRSHWIRICMIPGVLLKELAVGVDSNDDSYLPKNISLLVGNSESNLKELKAVIVPRETTGRYVLLRNLGTEYRYVQLNIRGCHNDGCDTRIRGLFVKGCKFAKEPLPTVLDTMVIWYLGILASTARAAMPVAPQLRETILTHSKLALQSLPALSLSPTSPARPEFLTPFVIAEMDKFLTTLCLPAETFVSVDSDSLQVLLVFALAHGGVNSILDCLHILLDNLALELPLHSLLLGLQDIRREKRQRHAECLKLALVSCDGGQKDDNHRPDNILTNDADSGSNSYVSEEGKKVVNVVLRGEEDRLLEVGRAVVKVPAGDQGAKAGLLFVFDAADPSAEGLLDPASKYDSWTAEDYDKLQKEREKGGGAVDEWTPIAYFETSKETSEADFVSDVYKTGKYLLLKFLGPRGEDAEQVGVHSVKLYGHSTTAEESESTAFLSRMDSVAPLPSEKGQSLVGGALLLTQVLHFLAAMLQDLAALRARLRAASLDPVLISEPHLTVEDLSLEKIWSLYIPLTLNPEPQLEYASLLCLHMLRSALPFIQPLKSSQRKGLAVPSAILAHLSGLLDSKDTAAPLRRLAQDIVVEGVVVFFPDATARRDYLLSMIDSVLEDNQPQSWWQKFEALCRHFSKTDSNSLLGLPKNIKENTLVDTAPALTILNRMLVVAAREAVSCMGTGASRPGDLVGLLSALQASLFFWCRRHITVLAGEGRKQVAGLVVEYTEKLVAHCVPVLRKLEALETPPESVLKALERTLLARTLPEMVVFLSTFTEAQIDKVKLLNVFYPLVGVVNSITSKLPGVFLKVDSDALKASDGAEATLGLWNRESSHNYENNARIHEDFICPGTTKFLLEFDSRCCTERRYDYLQFTDVLGQKKQFDDRVGSDRWPKTAEFPGHKLHFYFHSDGSTNEWGYKFTLKAVGRRVPQLAGLFDLQVSLGKLLGLICSTVLSTKTVRTQYTEKQSEAQHEEEQLVHSDLWKTIFRGGYMVSKFMRSLSGAFSASPADSALSSLLQDLARGAEDTGSAARNLLELCRTSYKGHYYGGAQVDTAVNAVFAALIWHSQEIREELMSHDSTRGGPSVEKVTPGLLKAFSAAEALRRELVEARQKLQESKEKEEDEEKRESINEDAPVRACHQKAVFLLKFAGLSRVHKSKRGKLVRAVSTVSWLKQHLHGPSEEEEVSQKYPSFELVLNFVKNEAMSMEKVQSLMQQRSTLASHVAQVYSFVAEYIRIIGMPNVFELPGLVFLQQLLGKQRHFPAHYASKLDGCGLELENQVRKSYRMMVNRLLETVNSYKPLSKEHSLAALLVSTCLVHLLDLEWQDYDHALLAELQLPEFLLHSAIKSSSCEERVVVEKFDREDVMMENYQLHMKFLEKFLEVIDDEDISFEELQELPLVKENRKMASLFAVAISQFTKGKMRVQCDSCGTVISGCWYHNLDIDADFDLCPTCFTSGSGTRPSSHSADQLYLYMGGYSCDHCHMAVVTHRFQSTTRKNFDLCLGCFRKEEAEGVTDSWTVHLLSEQPSTDTSNKFYSTEPEHSVGMPYKDGVLTKVGPAVELMVYNQHHCWILFNSLCLTMAASLSTSSAGGEYVVQASSILLGCLKLLAFELRAAILAMWENECMKKAVPQSSSTAEEQPSSPSHKQDPQAEAQEQATPPAGELALSRVVVDESPSQASPTGEQQEETDAPTDDQAAPPSEEQKEPTAPPTEEQVTEEKQEQAAPPSKEQQEQAAPPSKEQQEQATPPSKEQQEQAAPPSKEQQEQAAPPSKEQQEQAAPPSKELQEQAAPPSKELQEQAAPPSKEQQEQAALPSKEQQEQAAPPSKELQEQAAPPPPAEEDPLAAASKTAAPEDARIGNKEKAFALIWMDKMMGLLAAVLPREMSLSRWSNYKSDYEPFLAEKLLPTLLHLSSCTGTAGSHRLMSLRVAAQYMARISPQVADRAVDVALGRTPEVGEVQGLKTLQTFFSLGAAFLKKSEFTGAAAAAECLLQLAKAEAWQPAFAHTISHTLQTASQEMDLSSIFGLMVVAGFPQLPREGCVLSKPTDDGPARGVVTSLFPDRQRGVVVDLQSRTPQQQERLSHYSVEDTLHGCIDASRLPALLSLLRTALRLYRQELDNKVEATWVLALGLKALHVILQSQSSAGVVHTLLDAGLVPPIVKLASRPTHLSQKWHLTDLEVLGIHSYQPPSPKKAVPTAAEEGASSQEGGAKEGEEAERAVEDPSSPPSPPSDDAVLEGLSEDIQDMLKIMKEAFQCSLAVLRAMYEAAGDDMNQFIMSSEQYYDVEEGVLKPPDAILTAARRWEPEATSVRSAVQEIQDSLEDMGVTGLTPLETDIKTLEAVPESSSIFKKNKNLMKEGDQPTPQVQGDPSREESSKLLQEELARLAEKGPERAEVLKVQQAVVVLQAREVLATLLISWPRSGPRLNTTFLGGLDPTQYLCLLDLLSHHQPEEQRKKVFSTVLQCGESTEVVGLAVTAAQCMGEVCVGSEQRELHPPAQGADPKIETGKIVIANASSVAVKFHPVKGEILISSNESFSEHKKSHSATSTNQQDVYRHLIPGNTVHYKVTLQPVSEGKSPSCILKFTGTQVGRFETGHALLKLLLCEEQQFSRCLPLTQLWPCLITAACQHSGEQRLRVLVLIRAVLSLQGASPAPGGGGKLELSALKPLWQLYTTMMKEYDEKCKKNQLLAPEIMRVLTELFLTVENLAQELGVSQDLLVEMLTREGLHTWLEKGISNVAYLSLGLGLDNFAASAFVEAKLNYVPPKAEETTAETDGGSGGHKSSSESDDSSSDDSDDDDGDDDDDDDNDGNSFDSSDY